MIRPQRHDIEVFKRRRGKNGVEMAYFQTPVTVRRDERGPEDWLIVDFDEGGRLEIPIDGAALWIEPERH